MDAFGNKIKVGDIVHHSTNGLGVVAKVTPKCVRMINLGYDPSKQHHFIGTLQSMPNYKSPRLSKDLITVCTSCTKRLVNTDPTRFGVEYTMPNGKIVFIEFDNSYKVEI